MKTLFGLIILLAMASWGICADGMLVYEASSSSTCITTVNLSSSAATLISRTEASSVDSTRWMGKKITWYSVTMYSVSDSSGVFTFAPSDTTAPTLECDSAWAMPVPIGSSTPWEHTENFIASPQAGYLWGRSCYAGYTLSLKVLHRGR